MNLDFCCGFECDLPEWEFDRKAKTRLVPIGAAGGDGEWAVGWRVSRAGER